MTYVYIPELPVGDTQCLDVSQFRLNSGGQGLGVRGQGLGFQGSRVQGLGFRLIRNVWTSSHSVSLLVGGEKNSQKCIWHFSTFCILEIKDVKGKISIGTNRKDSLENTLISLDKCSIVPVENRYGHVVMSLQSCSDMSFESFYLVEIHEERDLISFQARELISFRQDTVSFRKESRHLLRKRLDIIQERDLISFRQDPGILPIGYHYSADFFDLLRISTWPQRRFWLRWHP